MKLQQRLPFTVLKPSWSELTKSDEIRSMLQQRLPFTVLKPRTW